MKTLLTTFILSLSLATPALASGYTKCFDNSGKAITIYCYHDTYCVEDGYGNMIYHYSDTYDNGVGDMCIYGIIDPYQKTSLTLSDNST